MFFIDTFICKHNLVTAKRKINWVHILLHYILKQYLCTELGVERKTIISFKPLTRIFKSYFCYTNFKTVLLHLDLANSQEKMYLVTNTDVKINSKKVSFFSYNIILRIYLRHFNKVPKMFIMGLHHNSICMSFFCIYIFKYKFMKMYVFCIFQHFISS